MDREIHVKKTALGDEANCAATPKGTFDEQQSNIYPETQWRQTKWQQRLIGMAARHSGSRSVNWLFSLMPTLTAFLEPQERACAPMISSEPTGLWLVTPTSTISGELNASPNALVPRLSARTRPCVSWRRREYLLLNSSRLAAVNAFDSPQKSPSLSIRACILARGQNKGARISPMRSAWATWGLSIRSAWHACRRWCKGY